MANSFSFSTYSTFLFVLFLLGRVSANLSDDNFYFSKCPEALHIIQKEVKKAVDKEPSLGGALLRLHFHDCFVNGCDASVLLDDTANFKGEKNAGPNKNSLRGFEVIDKLKQKLEEKCPRTVSCADILAVAARDSVDALRPQPFGKRRLASHLFPFPTWRVDLGRRDSETASFNAANANLPAPTLNLTALIAAFAKKDFTTKEMVVLSGGHTIGKSRCTTFRNRIYNETNIDPSYASALKANCPRKAGDGDDNLAPADGTDSVFDNTYFTDLTKKKGLLHSDQELFNKGPTDKLVEDYGKDSHLFLKDFANAMVKMGRLGPLTGSAGLIRTNCRKIN